MFTANYPVTRMTIINRPAIRLFTGALALVAAGGLALSGCSKTKEAAKEAATGAARTTLAPAVNPVLDMLRKGKGEVDAGNLAAVATTMVGFDALWSKASPVIQPLAGDKWPAIESAAKTLSATFAGGAAPDASTAGAAISGLMGPLQGLMGK